MFELCMKWSHYLQLLSYWEPNENFWQRLAFCQTNMFLYCSLENQVLNKNQKQIWNGFLCSNNLVVSSYCKFAKISWFIPFLAPFDYIFLLIPQINCRVFNSDQFLESVKWKEVEYGDRPEDQLTSWLTDWPLQT